MGKKSRLKKERRLAKQQIQNTTDFPEAMHPIEKMFDMGSLHNIFNIFNYFIFYPQKNDFFFFFIARLIE